MKPQLNARRDAIKTFLAASAVLATGGSPAGTLRADEVAAADQFRLKYILGSCMYGYLYIGEILPEVANCGSGHIDLWPKVHGNQREQLDDLGEERFQALLQKHRVQVGCITQYPLGPFGLAAEMQLASRLGCRTIVTGGPGPSGLKGAELRTAIEKFVEKMQPHMEAAAAAGVTIAIENHAGNLFESADSLRYLAELRKSTHLAIALAPYHLPQDENLLSDLIRSLGPAIEVFYAWQHGAGCMERLPKDQELLQMPGRGALDFGPLLQALIDIKYSGWTEIFMHPFPRGIPILESPAAISAEINRARSYLTEKLAATTAGKTKAS